VHLYLVFSLKGALPARRGRLVWICLALLVLGAALVLARFSAVRVYPGTAATVVTVDFLLPMRPESLEKRLEVTPEIPGTEVRCRAEWADARTAVLKLEQKGRPAGQLLTFRIKKAPTVIPLLSKTVRGAVRPPAPLTVAGGPSPETVPSRGPVVIEFSTPVDRKSLQSHVALPAPGRLRPHTGIAGNRRYTDYSRWLYVPARPLEHGTAYRIILEPGLRSMGGTVLGQQQEIRFVTAAEPRVADSRPGNGEKGVPLYPVLEFTLDREVEKASVRLTDLTEGSAVQGAGRVKGKAVTFHPARALMPGTSHRAVLRAVLKDGEVLENYECTFTTADLGDRYWVDVTLGRKHTVTVYRGRQMVRHMPASGGRPDSPTPTGCFYTQDRGYSFWSARFGEGATYWVRLVGQVLIHSVPKDSSWRTKEDEHAKLGLPASHGCIRLDEEDARWFFENIPRGTPVFIHS